MYWTSMVVEMKEGLVRHLFIFAVPAHGLLQFTCVYRIGVRLGASASERASERVCVRACVRAPPPPPAADDVG